MKKVRINYSQLEFTQSNKSGVSDLLASPCRCLSLCKMLHPRRIAVFFVIFFIVLGLALYFMWNTNSSYDSNSWICLNHTCSSCLKLDVKSIGLNNTICVNVKYIAEDIGVFFTIWDVTRAISMNRTLPAQSLLLLRVQEPFVKKPGEIHVYFESVTVTPIYLWACGIVEARMNFLFLQEFRLGCFKVTSASKKSHNSV